MLFPAVHGFAGLPSASWQKWVSENSSYNWPSR